MVLIVDDGDGDFSGLQQVSDEELAGVEGQAHSAISDGVGSVPDKRDDDDKIPEHTTGGDPLPSDTGTDYTPPVGGGYGGGWNVDF
jgi:hypothetical protein